MPSFTHAKARVNAHTRARDVRIDREGAVLAAAAECLRAAPEAWRWPDEQDHARPHGRQGKVASSGLAAPNRKRYRERR